MLSLHATALLIGPKAVLIRGPSGSGKSRLALGLLDLATPLFRALIGDDLVHVEAHHGRLIVSGAEAISGMIEMRHVGLLERAFVARAVVALDVELMQQPERLPDIHSVRYEGVNVPHVKLCCTIDAPDAFRALHHHLVSG